MSAKDYYGSGAYPQQQAYAAPAQAQYAHPAAGGYVPPGQPQYHTSTPSAYGALPAPAAAITTNTYPAPSPYDHQHQHQQPGDQDKGLVATVVGGSAGGLLAHKVGKTGKFKTFLGAAAGAAVANAIEHRLPGGKHAKHAKHGHTHHHHGQGPAYHPAQQHYGHGRQSQHGGGGGGLLSSVGGLLGGDKHHRHDSYHSHHTHHGGHGC